MPSHQPGDLRSSRLICLKGGLFLLCGLCAGGLLLLDHPNVRTTVLLALTVWCCCRSYYFAFYVVQHYVDDDYRFRGLVDFLRYMIRRRSGRQVTATNVDADERAARGMGAGVDR